jgi:hypothetical protein
MEEVSLWLIVQLALVSITVVALMFLRGLQESVVVLASLVVGSAVLAYVWRPWA